jgi:hypothetical protein
MLLPSSYDQVTSEAGRTSLAAHNVPQKMGKRFLDRTPKFTASTYRKLHIRGSDYKKFLAKKQTKKQKNALIFKNKSGDFFIAI